MCVPRRQNDAIDYAVIMHHHIAWYQAYGMLSFETLFLISFETLLERNYSKHVETTILHLKSDLTIVSFDK